MLAIAGLSSNEADLHREQCFRTTLERGGHRVSSNTLMQLAWPVLPPTSTSGSASTRCRNDFKVAVFSEHKGLDVTKALSRKHEVRSAWGKHDLTASRFRGPRNRCPPIQVPEFAHIGPHSRRPSFQRPSTDLVIQGNPWICWTPWLMEAIEDFPCKLSRSSLDGLAIANHEMSAVLIALRLREGDATEMPLATSNGLDSLFDSTYALCQQKRGMSSTGHEKALPVLRIFDVTLREFLHCSTYW